MSKSVCSGISPADGPKRPTPLISPEHAGKPDGFYHFLYKKSNKKHYLEYCTCIRDLLGSRDVQSMQQFVQHKNVSCLEHCFYVSYDSFLICRLLGLDYRSAARGGLLHDLFLYDWRIKSSHRGPHAFRHPGVALRRADRDFTLNQKERDIIRKHMWPLTLSLPRYPESLIVSCVDKFSAAAELLSLYEEPGNRRFHFKQSKKKPKEAE